MYKGFEQRHHLNKVRRKFKYLKDINTKSFLLLGFAGEKTNLEIEDPFYLQEEDYNNILRRIENGVIRTIQKIIEKNKT